MKSVQDVRQFLADMFSDGLVEMRGKELRSLKVADPFCAMPVWSSMPVFA